MAFGAAVDASGGSSLFVTIHGKIYSEGVELTCSPLPNGNVRPVISLPVTDRTKADNHIQAAP